MLNCVYKLIFRPKLVEQYGNVFLCHSICVGARVVAINDGGFCFCSVLSDARKINGDHLQFGPLQLSSQHNAENDNPPVTLMKMLFTKILFSINVFENYGNSQSVNTLSKY